MVTLCFASTTCIFHPWPSSSRRAHKELADQVLRPPGGWVLSRFPAETRNVGGAPSQRLQRGPVRDPRRRAAEAAHLRHPLPARQRRGGEDVLRRSGGGEALLDAGHRGRQGAGTRGGRGVRGPGRGRRRGRDGRGRGQTLASQEGTGGL